MYSPSSENYCIYYSATATIIPHYHPNQEHIYQREAEHNINATGLPHSNTHNVNHMYGHTRVDESVWYVRETHCRAAAVVLVLQESNSAERLIVLQPVLRRIQNTVTAQNLTQTHTSFRLTHNI